MPAAASGNVMSDSSALPKSCPKCGTELPAEATDGLCPRCLMGEAMQPTLISDAAKPKRSAILTPEELAPFFPSYEILRMLGRGGMGAVYLARQISLNRLVAIKILPADLEESDKGFAERFKNEAQAMAQLSHPGIVAVYDFGQTTNGLLYIVMEYIEGTDVQLMITSQGRLHSAHAMAITAHVCDALAYAHACGIIHRDIKPSNIMVGNNGVVKVADFGLAKMSQGQTTGLTQSGMAMGTLHFMAPEALMLGSAVDHRADIYAVGVMLYQMLTGKLPQGMFEMPSFQVPGLDPRYDGIVARALREDREVRYQAAGELRHDLDAILTQPVEKVAPEAEEVKALPPVEARGRKKARVPSLPPPQAASPAPTNKKPVGLILTVLGVTAALAGAFVYFRDNGTATTTQPELAANGAKFTSDLVSWWKADGDAQDSVGSNHGAMHGKADFTDGLFGKAFRLNGGFVEVPDAPSLRFGPDSKFSVSLWAYRTDPAPIFHLFGRRVPHPGVPKNDGYQLGVSGNRLQTPLNEWVCWTYVYDGESESVYIDGRFAGRLTGLGKISAPNSAAFTIGTSANFQEFHGLIDDVRMYGRALSATEIQELFDSQWQAAAGKLVKKTEHPSSTSTAIVTATQDAPFINTLGMKFVPVPGTNVLMCMHETRKSDYAAFAAETPGTDSSWVNPTFMNPTFEGMKVSEGDDHPVVSVNSLDAEAFCQWLSKKEGRSYRLPSWREWGWAVGTGPLEHEGATVAEMKAKVAGIYPWGRGWPPPKGAGNMADEALKARQPTAKIIAGYQDGYATTAPVMSFPPNEIGIYDLCGNVNEWCGDITTKGDQRKVRSSSWMTIGPDVSALSSNPGDGGQPLMLRCADLGFRVVLVPVAAAEGRAAAPSAAASGPSVTNPPNTALGGPSALPSAASPATATQAAPFTNTLGMMFVPVPIPARIATRSVAGGTGPARSASPSDAGGGPTDGKRVLFSVWETRVQDYEVFVKEAKRRWPEPRFAQGPTHPAGSVSWDDAQAFCAWLTLRERMAGRIGVEEFYRLPADHEWSCAVGLGALEDSAMLPVEKHEQIKKLYPWGDAWPIPPGVGNYSGEECTDQKIHGANQAIHQGYRDDFTGTSPVGCFRANMFGLLDMGGNVWEWCDDWFSAQQLEKVSRGSAFSAVGVPSSYRLKTLPAFADDSRGFRCVLEVPVPHAAPPLPTTGSSPSKTPAPSPSGGSLPSL